jgi:hypothetical protein
MNDLWSFDFSKNTAPSVNNALIHFNPHISNGELETGASIVRSLGSLDGCFR